MRSFVSGTNLPPSGTEPGAVGMYNKLFRTVFENLLLYYRIVTVKHCDRAWRRWRLLL